MKKLYKLLLICLLIIAGGGNALKAQSYNSDNSETANRAETPTYISKIAVASGENASDPKNILNEQGFTIIDYDLNKGCGSHTHYIYMGYKTTTNPADAITGIFFSIESDSNPSNSVTFDGETAYLLGGSNESNPGANKAVDLNVGAGGDYIYTYVTRNTSRAAVLNEMYFNGSKSANGYVTPDVNLNSGTSGGAIYLHYKQYSAQVYANLHYINESCQSVSKKFYGTLLHHLDDVEITPSIPTLLTYDDRSLAFMCWKDNTEAMMDYEYISKININLESSGMTFYGLYYFSPQTPLNLRFDANGGTGAPEDQKTDIYGLRYLNAGNGTPVYELSTFQIPNNICTKVGTCKFLGWSTDPNANSAEYQPGQSIDIALNTTLYAIYDSAHEYENGFCSICGAYEPAELVNGYYQIKTADNLFWFAEYVNTIDRTASAKLMNDIDLENRPWTPIGTTGESSHNFRGHFDGNGKTITGLNVTVTRNGGGFFGEVRLGTVEDFTIYGEVKLNGNHSYVGGVIGSAPGANSNQPEHNGATIRNITSYVNVTLGEGSHGSNHVAGFIGYANHETLIENCTWYGTLDLGPYRAQDGVGGLVGKANDNSEITIRNCAAYGTIKTSYQSGSYNSHNSIYIGGIVSNSVASAQTTLENCIWAGTLINNTTNLGDNAHISAIGTLNGIKSVSNCYALNNMPYITTNKAHDEGITVVTAEQLASGEIAYKLQGTQATQIWGQNIDNGETADTKPILGGAKVYEIIYSGGGIYTNTIITASGRCGINLYWKVSDNTLTIFGTGAMYNYGGTGYIAPWRSLNPAPTSLVLEEGITTIGDWAFAYCSSFKGSLTIPNSVTSIGNSAFYECSGFNGSLTIGNSVTSIGNLAFYECSGFTGSLTIPNSVTTIGEDAFSRCSGFTGSLTIPNSVTTIGNSAFSSCSGFTGSLTIGNSVTTIGEDAFYLCEGFTKVHSFAETAPTFGYAAFYFDTNSNATLYYPISSEQSYEEKGWFKHYFSKCIGINGICGDNLYWKVSDNTLTIFGTGAMEDYDNIDNKAPWRSLNPAPTSLVLEEGITYIGIYAFYGCDGFTKVHSSAVIAPTLGAEAFANINENAILCHPVSSELSYEGKGWFEYFQQHVGADGKCGDNLFWYVDDTNTLTIFGTGAMYDYDYSDDKISPWRKLETAPTTLVLEEGITTIGNYAFYNCSGFTEVYSLAKTAPTLGTKAFTGTNSNATLYYPVSSEQSYNEKGWFNYFTYEANGKCGDNLYWYVDDENILTIFGTGAMYDYGSSSNKAPWRSLNPAPTSLVLEEGITHIGNSAFYSCEGLIEVHSSAATAPTLGTDAFANINENATLYYPVSSYQSYDENGWFNYFPYEANGKCGNNLYWYVDDENILTIFGTGAMYNYGSSSNKAPWRSLKRAPESLVLEEGITHIGNSAFHGCSSFTGSLTIPNSVTTIGVSAFDNCPGFTGDLTIPNNVISIGKTAFWACKGFTGSLTIPNSVTTFGDYAFQYCDGFTGIFFYRDANPTIGTSVFSGINAKAKVYVPVIWKSFSNIPSGNLVKMATFVGEQSGWVFPEGMTEVSADDHVAINAAMVISGQQSAVSGQQSANSLSVKSFGLCGNENTTNGSITIEDGGQLYCEVARGEVTVKKEILGYQQSAVSGQQSESESKWYTIASPLKDTIQIIPDSSFLTSNSDLYRYDEPSYTWQNAKNSANNGFNTIDPGRGYLYANAENTTLKFKGNINTETVTYNLTAKSDVLNGFHLVGNPFTHNITFAHLNATEGASLVNGYYVLNGEGAWGATLGSNEEDIIKVGQGVLVKATAEGTLAISRQQSRNSNLQSAISQQSLCISVFNAKYSDRAFVVFDKGVGLDKMNHENEDIPLLYIPMEDADYAIAMMDMNVNEIPVNFETNVMGEYTISLRQENCEFDELYLLDKETDEKVNILEQDYTFIATSSENPERFILMKDNGQQTTDNSHFAYINNDDIVIYNIEGDADIKIFDALGRCVYQGESSDETTRIANGYSAGVYMIQKVDDNGVKVQKLMID